jgi:hypothetical protein
VVDAQIVGVALYLGDYPNIVVSLIDPEEAVAPNSTFEFSAL